MPLVSLCLGVFSLRLSGNVCFDGVLGSKDLSGGVISRQTMFQIDETRNLPAAGRKLGHEMPHFFGKPVEAIALL